MHRVGGVDNSLCDHVAFHDAAENIHEDCLHIFVGDQNLECFSHLVFGRATADIEEISWAAAVKLDDVHRGHGQAGTINQTRDVTVESDVVETVLRSFDFARIFFCNVAHDRYIRVSIKRVIVKIEFCVECQHLALARYDQRIDFNH